VNAPVQVGPNIAAVAVYLVVFGHVAVERAALLIADLCGMQVSTGWVSAQVAKAAAALTEANAAIVATIRASPVLGTDETSVSVGGTRYWLHVARTEKATAYHVHPHRGRDAVDAFGVLPGYTGVIAGDALAVYDGPTYATATHALCGAHLLRDLTAAAQDNPDQIWPGQARDALLALNRLVRAADPGRRRWLGRTSGCGWRSGPGRGRWCLSGHPRAASRGRRRVTSIPIGIVLTNGPRRSARPPAPSTRRRPRLVRTGSQQLLRAMGFSC
jgi:hypothetical protein